MYKTIIEPRVSETDGVGHINNTTLPIWFEAARNPFFKVFMPDNSFSSWKIVLANMSVDFLGQIYFGENVEIHTWVKKIGNSSIELYEEAFQGGRLCARGRAVYVNFDMDKQKAVPIGEEIRDALGKHVYKTETVN
ncbi:acyl-CoA thioesterase [Planococcus salinus]|uniref:Acyl-CoA thioesterase n=1 Tax=Planococcus salinus TaxID=1848460 RepID=A0A3M8P9H2_9BACL|nr:thioesterase family protein [Planococcus salinus]RNF40339.1 acyl-CoA thioesterase [Planococcus salinus]